MSNNYETLLDKAIQNLNCAEIIYSSELIHDEAYLNYVGYHLQQAVELSLKHMLEMNGVEAIRTHEIEQIIQLAKERNVDLMLTKFIYERAEMFTSWEAKTRYIKNYKLEHNKVAEAIKEVRIYIDTLSKAKLVEQDNRSNKRKDFVM